MRIGLVLEGGGMRGLYTAGVLDGLLEANPIHFESIVSVSAGALFGLNYLSKQKGRALRYNKQYASDKRYMSIRSWITTGNFVNKEFTYYQVPFNLDKFDNDTFKQSRTDFYVALTNVKTGQAEYHLITDVFTQMEELRATSALPLISKMVPLYNNLYLDGGITDSIPIDFAQTLNVDKTIVILTRPAEYQKRPLKSPLYKWIYHKYPNFVRAMYERATVYNKTLEKITQLEQQGKIFVIRPSKHILVKRLEKNITTLEAIHSLGITDVKQLTTKLQQFLDT